MNTEPLYRLCIKLGIIIHNVDDDTLVRKCAEVMHEKVKHGDVAIEPVLKDILRLNHSDKDQILGNINRK